MATSLKSDLENLADESVNNINLILRIKCQSHPVIGIQANNDANRAGLSGRRDMVRAMNVRAIILSSSTTPMLNTATKSGNGY